MSFRDSKKPARSRALRDLRGSGDFSGLTRIDTSGTSLDGSSLLALQAVSRQAWRRMDEHHADFFPEASVGLISDVHGNFAALELVLDAFSERDVKEIYVAGDMLLGGPEPLAVWMELQRIGAHCIRGASDTALARIDPDTLEAENSASRAALSAFEQTRASLGDLILERIRRLPDQRRVRLPHGAEMLVVHGSPSDPLEEITHDVSEQELITLLSDDPADVIVCGASHVPFHMTVDDYLIVNVGSVGQAPSGDVAHFSILTSRPSGLAIEQHHVELPRTPAAQA